MFIQAIHASCVYTYLQCRAANLFLDTLDLEKSLNRIHVLKAVTR